LSLLTNDEVLAADQKGSGGHELFTRGNQVAWTADVPGSGAKYLAVFNLGDAAGEDIHIDWADLKLPKDCTLRDLWRKEDSGVTADGKSFQLKSHAAAFYKVTPAAAR
jgi:alpha-galactosidase